MGSGKHNLDMLYQGLKALVESAFPKKCPTCGALYADAGEFVAKTAMVGQQRSGLKQSRDDDDATIVELYRNCSCGSTLMECFGDRRDESDGGIERRQRFQQVLDEIVAADVEPALARREILKTMRGEDSPFLKNLLGRIRRG